MQRLMLLALLIALPAFTRFSADTSRERGEGDGPHRAGLVVRHGDGRVVTACVSFSEPTITGEELLTRSGLSLATAPFGLGAAVCALDGEGCQPPGQGCFCHCQNLGEKCTYWVYSHLGDSGRWQVATSGAGDYTVRDGAVDGWTWGGDVALPALTFADVCSAPATATVAPLPTTVTLLPGVTATPMSLAFTPSPSPSSDRGGASSPPWSAYVAFVLLGLMLVGGLSWLLGRQRGRGT